MFKTPSFWYKGRTVISTFLEPIAWFYQLGHRFAQALPAQTYKATIPVICIGNAVAGGGGKTPIVIALVKAIKESGLYKNPYILTRGYGRKNNDAVLVNIAKHATENVGDEPLLLAQHAPTIVSANRAEGVKLAETHTADIIIMDDGLLNKTLHKDLNILVVDRQIDFGNNKTLPAGPLREPLSHLLPKINAVITIGRAFDTADQPVFEAVLQADKTPDPDKKYVAFAGLAIPDKFKNTLLDLNYNLTGWYPFPDHHVYSQNDIKKLKNTDGQLITTEKDYVRLPDDFKKQVETLHVTILIKNLNNLMNFIKNNLSKS